MKIKTMTLSYPHLNCDRSHNPKTNPEKNQVWRVDQLTDSTDYLPGQQLHKSQVDELCAARDWKVTIRRTAP